MAHQPNKSEGFTLAEILVLMILAGSVASILFLLFFGGNANSLPDENVVRAAKTLTADPQVASKSFAWVGCSKGDTWRYQVSDKNGKTVGYVCQGLWFRGATPRFN